MGEFNATDPDGDVLTYSLVSGEGGSDNSKFTIDANGVLKTAQILDHESAPLNSIRVQVVDELNASMAGIFTISVTDVNEPPRVGTTVELSVVESEDAQIFSSTWDRTYGGGGDERVADSIITSDGGYLIVGTSDSNKSFDKLENSRGGRDYWVVKLDDLGNKVWDRTFGGSEKDLGNGAVEVTGGGYLIWGSSSSPADGDRTVENKGFSDYWIVRIDADGNKLWTRLMGAIVTIIVMI